MYLFPVPTSEDFKLFSNDEYMEALKFLNSPPPRIGGMAIGDQIGEAILDLDKGAIAGHEDENGKEYIVKCANYVKVFNLSNIISFTMALSFRARGIYTEMVDINGNYIVLPKVASLLSGEELSYKDEHLINSFSGPQGIHRWFHIATVSDDEFDQLLELFTYCDCRQYMYSKANRDFWIRMAPYSSNDHLMPWLKVIERLKP